MLLQSLGFCWSVLALHLACLSPTFYTGAFAPIVKTKKSALPPCFATRSHDEQTRPRTKKKERKRTTEMDRSKKKKRSQQETDGTAGNMDDSKEALCLRYSHLFQRHVVYRPRRGRLSFYWNGTASNLFCSPDDDCDEVVASFQFLDDALAEFSNLKMVQLPEACFQVGEAEIHRFIVSGGGPLEGTAYRGGIINTANGNYKISNVTLQEVTSEHTRTAYETLLFLSSLAGSNGGQRMASSSRRRNQEITMGSAIPVAGQEQIAAMLDDRVGKRRFLVHTQATVKRNYDRIMDLLTRGDKSASLLPQGLTMDYAAARRVLANFPQLCLYDYDDVEERVQFLLSPQPPPEEIIHERTKQKKTRKKKTDFCTIDWPRLSSMGYGAGFTVQQATDAIRVIPQLLSIHHDDAMKPSILFFYQNVELPFELFEEARAELDVHLTGATASDVWTMALLHSLGVSWEQISIVLDAFPSLVCCDTEPSWELIDHGPVSDAFRESDLTYLRKRLQIRPSEVFSMIKTHTRLSSYKAESKIRSTLDALESRVGFSSSELRKVLLRMPSLIGMSVNRADAGLELRLAFFYDEVGMSPPDLRKAVLKQPSLLQYSVDQSLRPKLKFLKEELKIPSEHVSKIVVTSPSIMGLSLHNNLKMKVRAIMEGFGLDKKDLGEMVVRYPQILTASWKRGLEPKLRFFTEQLLLSKSQVRELVKKSPRTLIQSVEKSFLPKLKMIQAALDYEAKSMALQARTRTASAVVTENPALLLASNKVLEMRLGTYIGDPGTSLSDALLRRSSPRRKRSVLLVSEDSGNILEEFPSVRAAAAEYDVNVSTLYAAIRNGRALDGMKFIYGATQNAPKQTDLANSWTHDETYPMASDTNEVLQRPEQVDSNSTGLIAAIHQSTYQVKHLRKNESSVECLEIFVSGRAYPPDDIDRVRGIRRTGGVSIYFPQVCQGGAEFSTRLRLAAESSFGQIMPGIEGGSNFTDGTILVGFPYLRPSRNRCSLYACHDALKVVLQLLKQASVQQNLQDTDFHIFVSTDSDYSWNLLRNKTRLLEWGSYPTMDSFRHDVAPLPSTNPDLLYPLSRTYHRLVTSDLTDENGNRLMIGKRLDISFRHSSTSLLEEGLDQLALSSGKFAERAALWQYTRSRHFD